MKMSFKLQNMVEGTSRSVTSSVQRHNKLCLVCQKFSFLSFFFFSFLSGALKRMERGDHDEYTNRTLDLSKVVTDSAENKASKMQW